MIPKIKLYQINSFVEIIRVQEELLHQTIKPYIQHDNQNGESSSNDQIMTLSEKIFLPNNEISKV